MQIQENGNERLAVLSASIGHIATESQFEHVQRIFEVTKRRERTSIPQVKVDGKKYRGRMLSPDDVLNLFAGNITTCCQRFGDVGEGAMLVGSLEENGGIFVIEELDENGKTTRIIGQSLTIRQRGETGKLDRLTFDNIEIDDGVKLSEEESKEILEIYIEAGKEAIERDRRFLKKQLEIGNISQEQYDSMVLKEVIAGVGYNDLAGLRELKEAEVVVPEEAYRRYQTITGEKIYIWIDSTNGQAPHGSGEGAPVILAEMEAEEREAIRERIRTTDQSKIDTNIPLWYRGVRDIQEYEGENITLSVIKKIKGIEQITYREEQQLMNNNEVTTERELAESYGLEKVRVVIGGNEDWYLIYGEDENGNIEISDLTIIGGINAERNGGSTSKADKYVSTLEATSKMYEVLIESAKAGKRVYTNATQDTSLINIKSMIKKGMLEVRDYSGRKIIIEEEELVYEETKEKVEMRTWGGYDEDEYDDDYNDDYEEDDNDGQTRRIKMMDLEMIPEVEKIQESKEQIDKLLERARERYSMKGSTKEKGLEDLRKEIIDKGER